jgi:hypothetical protein
LPLSGGTLSGTLNFLQPVGLGFANGQYIKDNGNGGLIISSGAAVNINGTSVTINGNTAWHAGNDGSGSGLDADTVDGVQADSIVYGNARGTNQSITNNNNDLDKTGYYTADAFATRPSGVANWMYIEHIKLYNDNTQYQKQIGYDTYDDRMWVRTKSANTWSSWKQIWTSDSLTNLNQLANGPGYITGFTETDPTVPSHVKAITTTNISNWNAAHSWGNHASAGYRVNSISNTAYVYATSYRTENYDFTLDPRLSIDSMSIKLWDNYFNNSGLGVDYGSLLDIHGRGGHVHSQFYMDASNLLWYRSSPYAGGWNTWQQIWTSGTLTNLNQLVNGPGYITGYTETDTLSSVTARGSSTSTAITINGIDSALKVQHDGTSTAWRGRIGSFNASADKSSFLGNYTGRAGVFGHNNALSAWDELWVNTLGIYGQGNLYLSWFTYVKANGGDTNYSIWHAGNLTNLNQLTNGPGYITSYTETDTLNSVTTRGNSTSNAINVGGLTVSTRDVDVVTHQGRFQVYNASATGNLGYRIQTDEQGGWRWQFVDGGNNEYFGVDYPSGNLIALGTITEQSSLRYKENIINLESITDKVDRLRPVRYNKIGNTNTEIGLIAEEVAEVFPEFVNYNADGEAESLNYTRLSVVLLQTVKELSDKINKLETK